MTTVTRQRAGAGGLGAVGEATTLECTWIHRQLNGDYWLYFGVPGGDVSLLAVGAAFDTLWTKTWNKVRWIVVEGIVKYGKHKGEIGRWYEIVQERYFDADECAVWQEYIEQWEAKMKALQAAFEEMKFQLEQYTDGWIISVYGDATDYVDGTTWHVEDGVPPVMYLSDQLYAMYCKSIGMENVNVRPANTVGDHASE